MVLFISRSLTVEEEGDCCLLLILLDEAANAWKYRSRSSVFYLCDLLGWVWMIPSGHLLGAILNVSSPSIAESLSTLPVSHPWCAYPRSYVCLPVHVGILTKISLLSGTGKMVILA
jgi:hypothetical protein